MLGSHPLGYEASTPAPHTQYTQVPHRAEVQAFLLPLAPDMRLTIWPNFCPLLCLLILTMTTKQRHTRKVSTHFPYNLETLQWYGSFPTRRLWSLILFAGKCLLLFLLLKYFFKGKAIASNHIQQVVVESLVVGRWKVEIWAWFYSPRGHKQEADNLLVTGAVPPHLLGLELSPGFQQQKLQIQSHSSPPVGNWTNPGASNYRNCRFLVLIPALNPGQITLLP